MALKEKNFSLAQECFAKTKDYSSFLLIASSAGDATMIQQLAKEADGAELDSLAFISRFLLADLEGCLQVSFF